MASAGSTIFQLQGSVTTATLQASDDPTTLTNFGDSPVSVSATGASVALNTAQASSDQYKAALTPFLGARLGDGPLTLDSSGKQTDLSLAVQKPERVGAVPIAAAYATAAGKLCVYVHSAGKITAIRIVKPVPSTEVGVAYVDPSLVGKKIFSPSSDLTRASADIADRASKHRDLVRGCSPFPRPHRHDPGSPSDCSNRPIRSGEIKVGRVFSPSHNSRDTRRLAEQVDGSTGRPPDPRISGLYRPVAILVTMCRNLLLE